jgi:hypothetical protein
MRGPRTEERDDAAEGTPANPALVLGLRPSQAGGALPGSAHTARRLRRMRAAATSTPTMARPDRSPANRFPSIREDRLPRPDAPVLRAKRRSPGNQTPRTPGPQPSRHASERDHCTVPSSPEKRWGGAPGGRRGRLGRSARSHGRAGPSPPDWEASSRRRVVPTGCRRISHRWRPGGSHLGSRPHPGRAVRRAGAGCARALGARCARVVARSRLRPGRRSPARFRRPGCSVPGVPRRDLLRGRQRRHRCRARH